MSRRRSEQWGDFAVDCCVVSPKMVIDRRAADGALSVAVKISVPQVLPQLQLSGSEHLLLLIAVSLPPPVQPSSINWRPTVCPPAS